MRLCPTPYTREAAGTLNGVPFGKNSILPISDAILGSAKVPAALRGGRGGGE